MMHYWIQLILMLVVILIASQLFSNALEHFGKKIGISAGVTGSVFAAIATALPETIIPVLAIIAGTADVSINQEISVGAILGAPLMLSTLSTMLMGLAVVRQRGIKGRVKPENSGFVRDLNFFLCAFFLAAIAMYAPVYPVFYRAGISFFLVILYLFYLLCTFKASTKLVLQGHGVVPSEPMFITKIGLKDNSFALGLQLLFSLILLILGAKGFIDSVEKIAGGYHISALLISLLIVPLATELPEKFNSIFWIRKNKDTLSFGNITGAMVFQGTLLPALGILLTPWQPDKMVETGIFITLCAAAWLRLKASKKGLRILTLLLNGCLYFIYLILIFSL